MRILLCFAVAALAGAQDYKTWSDYGGGPDSSQYSSLRQITKANVGQLQVAWSYRIGENKKYSFNN